MARQRFVRCAVIGTLASGWLTAAPTAAAAAEPAGCDKWLKRVCAGERPDAVSPSCLLGSLAFVSGAAEPPCSPYIGTPPLLHPPVAAGPSTCGWLEPVCAGEMPEEPTNPACVFGFYPFYPPAALVPCAPYLTETPPLWPWGGATDRTAGEV